MQIPTMMRAPVGEPTQDRRKAETPAPSSDEKSFDDMVKGGEPSVDDRTTRGGETPDLTDQGMPSAQTPAQARDMTMAAATTAIRQSFSLDVTPTDGATTATAIQSDGEVVVPANGHNGSLLQPTIPLGATTDAIVSEADAGGGLPGDARAVGASPATTVDEAAMRLGVVQNGKNGEGVLVATEASLTKTTDAVAPQVGSIDVQAMGKNAAQGMGPEAAQPTSPASNGLNPAQMSHVVSGEQAIRSGSVTTGEGAAPTSQPDATAIDMKTRRGDVASQASVRGTDSDTFTEGTARSAAVSATATAPVSTPVVTAGNNGMSVDDGKSPRGEFQATNDVQDAKPPTSDMTTPTPSASDKTAPQTALAYAQVQGSSELNTQGVEPSEMLDFRLDGVSSTVARESVQASVLTQVQRTELPHHIAGQIAEAARQLPDKPVEITLSPEELGRVKLTFHVSENGAMSVVVQAEKAETADLMRRNIHTLQEDFASMGYEGSTFEFQQEGQGHSSENAKRGTSNGSGSRAEQQVAADLDGAAASIQPHRLSLNGNARVDIRL
ncbi:flagellar hook-length control protein FliK [Celeribacter sp.]|uniref:flagellar hook-length control protein FliK n=1 Tax=Celeribacter sp. TaxID=1890673 RepID=UPI003A915006